jgi:hypothetical protein
MYIETQGVLDTDLEFDNLAHSALKFAASRRFQKFVEEELHRTTGKRRQHQPDLLLYLWSVFNLQPALLLVLLCVLHHPLELELLCGCHLALPLRLGFLLVLLPPQKAKSVLVDPEQNLPSV